MRVRAAAAGRSGERRSPGPPRLDSGAVESTEEAQPQVVDPHARAVMRRLPGALEKRAVLLREVAAGSEAAPRDVRVAAFLGVVDRTRDVAAADGGEGGAHSRSSQPRRA